MKVLYINNDGGGFADYVEVAEGTTVGQLFGQRMPGGRPHNYLIRVNRLPASAEQVPNMATASAIHSPGLPAIIESMIVFSIFGGISPSQFFGGRVVEALPLDPIARFYQRFNRIKHVSDGGARRSP